MISVEMPWGKHYPEGAYEKINDLDVAESAWDYIEKKFSEYGPENDALIYFGHKVSRPEYVAMVYKWARIFKGMGIQPDERVVMFSPFTLEVAAMLFGLNVIGATWVMPNMGASKESIAKCISDARFAVVYEGLYDMMSLAFEKKQFEKVIIVSSHTGMALPIRPIARITNARIHRRVMAMDKERNITAAQAEKMYGGYEGELKVPFRKGRVAFVNSSGGTTVSGEAKLIQTINESIVTMSESAFLSRHEYYYEAGDICLNMLPPFVSTSMFVLFIAPLISGGTVILEPRLNPDMFAKSLFKYRPNITLMPGKGWERYFDIVRGKIAAGKTPDLSHWKLPIIGGEGVIPEDLNKMNKLMKQCGSPTRLVPGYGMSEVFSVACVDFQYFGYDPETNKRDCIQVGSPFAGFTFGIFDKEGNELPAGSRGELWIKTPTMMKGYFGNEELTEEVTKDGWVHTGDYFESDENGVFYCYGRMQDNAVAPDGTEVYLFDIASRLRHDKDVYQTLVANKAHGDEAPRIIAHIVLNQGVTSSKKEIIERLKADMADWLPEGLTVEKYYIHDTKTFRTSPVMKTDKNYYKLNFD